MAMHHFPFLEEYRNRIAAHREAFTPMDPRFPLDEGDILYCGSSDTLPPWCSFLYVPWEEEISPELAAEVRIATSIPPETEERDVLERMAAGAQVLFTDPLAGSPLISLARDVDPRVVIGNRESVFTGSVPPGVDLWQDRGVYSCEATALATHLPQRDEWAENTTALFLNGTVLPPPMEPEIGGILPALPEEQRARMTSAAVQLRLALPGVPVVHQWEATLEGVEACVLARIGFGGFHPKTPGSLLNAPEGMIALRRDDPDHGTILCLHNLSRDYVEYRHRKDRFPWPETGVLRDLIADDLVFPTSEGSLFSLELTPYETLWLTFQ